MPKPNTVADEAPSLDELLELLQHSKSPLLDFNKQRIRDLFKQAITHAERRGQVTELKYWCKRFDTMQLEITNDDIPAADLLLIKPMIEAAFNTALRPTLIAEAKSRYWELQANAGGGERE